MPILSRDTGSAAPAGAAALLAGPARAQAPYPVLAPVKMIAEPWDTQGYQVGGFPADWSEWNGKFRDDVRRFWRGEPGLAGALGARWSAPSRRRAGR